MAKFIVRGQCRLSGSIKVNSAKNSAVAILCASVMLKNKVLFKDMPMIEEVNRILEILNSIGVKYNWLKDHQLQIDSSGRLELDKIDKQACAKVRSSLMLLGALAAREKQYKLYRSGGCKLGLRTVRPHLLALEKFGIDIQSKKDYYSVKNFKLKPAEVVMYEAGDTPTENALMAAVLAPGKSVIKFASANYMVQDLCHFLNAAGADISGIGTSTLIINGVNSLLAVDYYHIMPDPLEAMAFLSLAITTKSRLTVKNCPVRFLELELEKLKVMRQRFKVKNHGLSKNGKFKIVDIEIIPSDLQALPDKIHGMPFPGINIDNIPFFVPIATQAEGRTLIHDWVYENRTVYFLEFVKLGAKVTMLDPHRVFVEGPTELKGREMIAPDGIRPAMALLIGMIAAEGESILRNIYVIERGYENLANRLKKIGANIRRIKN